jgi:hypothetical protein
MRTVKATEAHAIELAAVMRADDRAEIAASPGYSTAEAAVQDAILMSDGCAYATYLGGELAAVWGVVLNGEEAVPWLLTGEVVDRKPVAFYKACKKFLPIIRAECGELTNWVDAGYTKALRWARHLGFKVGPPEKLSNGSTFCRITLGG